MSSSTAPAIVLYRSDLRLADNRALTAAVATKAPVLAVYVHDQTEAGLGAAALWWRHFSLRNLQAALARHHVPLILRRGEGTQIVASLLQNGTAGVFWNRRYTPRAMQADAQLKSMLREQGLTAESFEGHLLHEPSRLRTGAGTPYRVYTPFRNALMATQPSWRPPLPAPRHIHGFSHDLASESLDTLIPLPHAPDWAGGLRETWQPGEDNAQETLADFIHAALPRYATDRDRPGQKGTSCLSPYLAHGEITPFQILHALNGAQTELNNDGMASFNNEILWREFAYHLLFHRPDLGQANYNTGFDSFPWLETSDHLDRWQRGGTGYPIVDAGMRELWHTGWMHNRVRMIVASFLTKHLMIHWRRGEEWFADTLVDADAASNPVNWQWVAGCGADAAPYFRIFNPVLQSRKFDPQGMYLRRWLPELSNLPDKYIHSPWEAPTLIRNAARLPANAPWLHPIVDHSTARAHAMAAWQSLRQS